MLIGVICEGPTDYPALYHFLGGSLRSLGMLPRLISLFPQMDKTRPEGGWANVLLWLNKNPPGMRVPSYFGGGLFGGALSTEPLDAIIIQLDADIIEDGLFRKFVNDNYNYVVKNCDSPSARAEQIRDILMLAANFETMANVDRRRHVIIPAVEATETWCVAAFHPKTQDFESLRGNALTNAFMSALEQSEGREPKPAYAKVDKSRARREKFCERHSGGASRVATGCAQFARAIVELVAIGTPQVSN